jgi:hypothetical protein
MWISGKVWGNKNSSNAAKALVIAGIVGFAPAATLLPASQTYPDPSGVLGQNNTGGAVLPSSNAFFQPLGTNGRSCATCHLPSNGFGLSVSSIQSIFNSTNGTDPLFNKKDGTGCPSMPVATLAQRQNSSALLLSQGLIRIPHTLQISASLMQFQITAISDPYGCNTNTNNGLTAWGAGVTPAGVLSVYRRPLPATNLLFNASILADNGASSLSVQASNATLGHENASVAPTTDQVNAIVNFESGNFTAQLQDNIAGWLTASGVTGGPDAISSQPFFLGINDPVKQNPTGAPFNAHVFSLFDAWTNPSNASLTPAQLSIGRGQTIFNSRTFNITGVSGLNTNSVRGQKSQAPVIAGTCGTCHDTPNVGTHSINEMMNEGTNEVAPVGGLNVSALPLFTLKCVAGPLSGQTFQTRDPGAATLDGFCRDIGKTKVLGLRSLASRAPFFHNGSAPDMATVVNFYNVRFNMGLSAQDQTDLINFLNAL